MKLWGTCIVVKSRKRLHIQIMENGRDIYTPPNFVSLHSRDPLKTLADRFTELQRRDISLIADFEYANSANGKKASIAQR